MINTHHQEQSNPSQRSAEAALIAARLALAPSEINLVSSPKHPNHLNDSHYKNANSNTNAKNNTSHKSTSQAAQNLSSPITSLYGSLDVAGVSPQRHRAIDSLSSQRIVQK